MKNLSYNVQEGENNKPMINVNYKKEEKILSPEEIRLFVSDIHS